MTPWTLEVQRSEFLKALKVLVAKASQAGPQARALLTFCDGQLSIALVGISGQVPAAGNWPGEVRVPAFFLGRLARALPEEDPLRLQADGEHFTVSRLSMPCECRPPAAAGPRLSPESIPMNLGLHELLALRSQYSAAEIEDAGVAPVIAAAEQKLSDVLQRAAAELQPYGVTTESLRQLVDKHAGDTGPFEESDKAVMARIVKAWMLLAHLGYRGR